MSSGYGGGGYPPGPPNHGYQPSFSPQGNPGPQPGPYGQQPGPYGQQPGPYGQQPGPFGQPGQFQPAPFGPGPFGAPLPPRKSSNRVLWIVLGSIAGVALLGAAAVVAGVYWIYDKVETDARASEAKSNLRAMARAAQRAYERSGLSYSYDYTGSSTTQQKLCGSAQAVPAEIPSEKYFPTTTGTRDFTTGDSDNGWKCLAYTQYGSIQHQYEYRVGKNYKGPKRGGPDPGPDGFEVSAEGDADGDGKTSLFTMTGKVDKVTKTLKLDYDVFVSDADE